MGSTHSSTRTSASASSSSRSTALGTPSCSSCISGCSTDVVATDHAPGGLASTSIDSNFSSNVSTVYTVSSVSNTSSPKPQSSCETSSTRCGTSCISANETSPKDTTQTTTSCTSPTTCKTTYAKITGRCKVYAPDNAKDRVDNSKGYNHHGKVPQRGEG